MFKPVNAQNEEEYIAMLTEQRREIILHLDAIIQDTAPQLKRWFAYNMLGYGEFDYTDYKGKPGKWPVVAIASQKNYVSLYVCAIDDGEYLAEKYKDALGKVSVGKSCIRFKKKDDINVAALKKLLKAAEKTPGFEPTGKKK